MNIKSKDIVIVSVLSSIGCPIAYLLMIVAKKWIDGSVEYDWSVLLLAFVSAYFFSMLISLVLGCVVYFWAAINKLKSINLFSLYLVLLVPVIGAFTFTGYDMQALVVFLLYTANFVAAYIMTKCKKIQE